MVGSLVQGLNAIIFERFEITSNELNQCNQLNQSNNLLFFKLLDFF